MAPKILFLWHIRCNALEGTNEEMTMQRNPPRDRNPGQDTEVPSEDHGREAQDRARPTDKSGGAKSPVDSMHVDAPTRQKNQRGGRQAS